MIKIRRSVFETNSSMTHSMVLMSPDEYNVDHLAIDELTELALRDLAMVCLQSWLDDTAYFEHFHTTKMIGDYLVHAFGYYGHD